MQIMGTVVILALIESSRGTMAKPEWKISWVPLTPIRSGFQVFRAHESDMQILPARLSQIILIGPPGSGCVLC